MRSEHGGRGRERGGSISLSRTKKHSQEYASSSPVTTQSPTSTWSRKELRLRRGWIGVEMKGVREGAARTLDALADGRGRVGSSVPLLRLSISSRAGFGAALHAVRWDASR